MNKLEAHFNVPCNIPTGQGGAYCAHFRAMYMKTANTHIPGVSLSNKTCYFNNYLKNVLICTSLFYSAFNTYEICWNFSISDFHLSPKSTVKY